MPKGPVVAKPVLKADAPAKVEVVKSLPPEVKEAPKPTVNPVAQFLMTAMRGLREERGITPQENNKLFKAQHEALVNAGLAPAKRADEYTMQEAEALIDAMRKCFDATGTELKIE